MIGVSQCDEQDSGFRITSTIPGPSDESLSRTHLQVYTMTPPRTIRVAVVQACSAAFSIPDTLSKLKSYAQEASEKGVQLAVFPEAL